MTTRSPTRRTTPLAGARSRIYWSPRRRAASGAIRAPGRGSTKTSSGRFSDSAKKSGRSRAFSWDIPSRRRWPSACRRKSTPPGTRSPEEKREFGLERDLFHRLGDPAAKEFEEIERFAHRLHRQRLALAVCEPFQVVEKHAAVFLVGPAVDFIIRHVLPADT